MSMPAVPKGFKGYSGYSLPTMGGGQQDIYNLIKGQFQGGAGDVYSKLFGMARGDQGMFDQMEAPALRQFQEQIAPSIAARYSGSGIGSSSGMQNAISAAGGNLAESLQGQRMGLMRQSMADVLHLGDTLLGHPTQQFGLVQKQNTLRDLLQLLGGAGGQLGTSFGASKFLGF